jgi:ABC-type branched-subunit amino acid transport system substrate-binding protein
MSSPVFVVVDEDAEALGQAESALRERYERHYRIECRSSADEACDLLHALAADGADVAVVLSGIAVAATAGSDLFDTARRVHPTARRVVMLAWEEQGDPAIGDALFEAIASGQIDHYVLRPSPAPDEVFHNEISGLLIDWTDAERTSPHTVVIVGESWSGRAYELREALVRCALPHSFCLTDSDVAAKEINSTKFLGKNTKLVVDYTDTKSDKNAAVEASLKIASAKPTALVGWTVTPSFLAGAPNIQAAKIPSVAIMLTGDGVTEVGDYMFRTWPPLSKKSPDVDVQVAKAIGAKTAAYLTQSDLGSAVQVQSFIKPAMEAAGIKTVIEQTETATSTDVRAQMTAIKGANPDVVIVSSTTGLIPINALQAQEVGVKSQFIIGTGTNDTYLQQAGAALQCSVWWDPWAKVNVDAGNNKHFLEYWGVNGPNAVPDTFGAMGYGALWATAQAIKKAGSADGTAVRDALVKLKNIPTPMGNITYGKARDTNLAGSILQVRNNQIVVWDGKTCTH